MSANRITFILVALTALSGVAARNSLAIGTRFCRGDQCCKTPILTRTPAFDTSCLQDLTELANRCDGGECFSMPVSGGAWHWFHQSLIGRSGGYGIPGLRDTYFWYLFADPNYRLTQTTDLGGHLELRLRENGPFRSFMDDQVWPWESYLYLRDDEWGTFKAGQLFNRYGLFWDGVFFGNAAYFDGLKLDADYGVAWEKTSEVSDSISVDSYVQFFFHEDQQNGSFAGADAESIAGYSEENTGVFRLNPNWNRCDGSQVSLGVSAMVGQIDSRIALPSETVWGYGVDVSYRKGAWYLYSEASQTFGVRHPVNYISGGPSDELINTLTGVQYTRGAVTYRTAYSNSIYKNPGAVQNFLLSGVTVAVTSNIDLYVEWLHHRIDGAELPGRDGFLFNGIEWVINWRF